MGDVAAPSTNSPRLALRVLVFVGPGLRTSLLGGILVGEEAVGKAFDLSAGALAILLECIVFGSLLAVFLLPPLIDVIGSKKASFAAAALAVFFLVAGMLAAPHLPPGVLSTAVLYIGATLLGIFVAVLSPVTQTLLNSATTDNPEARHMLQSTWSAGQPAGFIVAAVAGGVLVEWADWWAALIVPLAFAIVSALSLLDRGIVHPVTDQKTETAPPANEIAVIVLALVAFEIWSTWGSLKSWLAPGVLAALLATVVITLVAINHLRHSPRPAISLAPFSLAGFAAATLILLIFQFPTTAEFEVLLLTELDHLSVETIGNRTAIGNIGQVVGTVLAAGLLYKRRNRLALVSGFLLTIAGLASYTLYPWWDSAVFVTVTRTITGLGGGLVLPVLFVIALDRMPVPYQLAAGTWLVLATIGGTEIGLALFDMVLEVSTTLTGSPLSGYLTVEFAQLAVGIATALLTLVFVARGQLPLQTSGKADILPTT